MGDLEVTIRHGGGGSNVAALVPLAGLGLAAAACAAVVVAVASIPVWVWVLAAVGITSAVARVAVVMRRHHARVDAAFAARRAERESAAKVEELDRHQRRLALAAASAPVIHNHLDADAIAAALFRQRPQPAPATVVREVQR